MQHRWIDPTEHASVVSTLLRYGLLKFSNKRDLPLKKGGTTDIYVNLRDARNHPEALTAIAKLYEHPIRKIGPDRFVEVPDSVSCFAPIIATRTGLPYLTIREEPKEGRVSKSTMIGTPRPGERVCIIDDVITDGASKIEPRRGCILADLVPEQLVVLVDRQQGWQEMFRSHDVDLPVWAGMTLHEVRRQLIESGAMERCDKKVEQANPIVVALDGKSWDEILPVIDELRPTGCILKVNDLLFNEGIKNLLPDLQVYGRVMADLKGHDIETTLGNIAKHFLKNPPWAVTVHASGGEKMIRAVVDALKGTRTKVLAVTVLTSLNGNDCEEIYHRTPEVQVPDLAALAARAGAHGFVCSPREVPVLREQYPPMTLVPAGIRSSGVAAGDQQRIGTPREAIDAGANFIVMGRQIMESKDPIAEVRRVLAIELGVI